MAKRILKLRRDFGFPIIHTIGSCIICFSITSLHYASVFCIFSCQSCCLRLSKGVDMMLNGLYGP